MSGNAEKRTIKAMNDIEAGKSIVIDDDHDKYAKERRREGGCLCRLIRSMFRFCIFTALICGVWIFYESGHIEVKVNPLDMDKFTDTAMSRYDKTVDVVSTATGYDLTHKKYGVTYGDEKVQQTYALQEEQQQEQHVSDNQGVEQDQEQVIQAMDQFKESIAGQLQPDAQEQQQQQQQQFQFQPIPNTEQQQLQPPPQEQQQFQPPPQEQQQFQPPPQEQQQFQPPPQEQQQFQPPPQEQQQFQPPLQEQQQFQPPQQQQFQPPPAPQEQQQQQKLPPPPPPGMQVVQEPLLPPPPPQNMQGVQQQLPPPPPPPF